MSIRRLARSSAAALALVALAALPAAAQRVSSQEIPLFGDTVVEVQVDDGGARFVPVGGPADDVTVKTTIAGTAPTQMPVQWTRVDKRVVVTIRGSTSSSLPFVAKTQSAYEVDYPARLKLIVHAFGGDIEVVEPSSSVVVSEASGDVLVRHPRGPVAVDDQSGNVVVHGAVAALDLAADAGDVNADLDPAWLPRPIRMQSAAGNLNLVVPQNFSARVDASSQNGSVHSALTSGAAGASGPPVWLYTERGDVTIAFPSPQRSQ